MALKFVIPSNIYDGAFLRYYHPLDETHLDAMRGLISPRGFHPAHQQVELVGAMRLRSTRTNRSAYAYAKDLIQS